MDCRAQKVLDRHRDNPQIRNALAELKLLYDSGVSLYTRTSIRSLYSQIQSYDGKQECFTVDGIDGKAYKIPLEPEGTSTPADGQDMEWVCGAPQILYQSIQSMARANFKMEMHDIYCALQAIQPVTLRNRLKGAILPPQQVSSVEQCTIARALLKSLELWKSTRLCQLLMSCLSSLPKSLPMKKIVGFACGSIADDVLQHKNSIALYQHAMILFLQQTLSLECFVQDPIYSRVDKDILHNLGVTVLDDPLGFLEVDDTAIVISYAPDVPVRQIICELARPAVLLWDRVEYEGRPAEPGRQMTDPESARVRAMIHRSYSEMHFIPDNDNHTLCNAFLHGAFYIRAHSDAASSLSSMEAAP